RQRRRRRLPQSRRRPQHPRALALQSQIHSLLLRPGGLAPHPPRATVADAMSHPTIDAGRMLEDLDRLNRCGADPGPGVSRIAFSPADRAGRDLVDAELRELGLDVTRDPAGNTIARLEGTERELPALAIGSHTDTVPDGGRFDGALGVVAAVACARALATAGVRLRHPLEVLNFVAEEATMGA